MSPLEEIEALLGVSSMVCVFEGDEATGDLVAGRLEKFGIHVMTEAIYDNPDDEYEVTLLRVHVPKEDTARARAIVAD